VLLLILAAVVLSKVAVPGPLESDKRRVSVMYLNNI